MYNILKKIHVFETNKDFAEYLTREKIVGPYVVSFCNAHAINMTYKNAAFLDDMMSANLLLRDGIGVKIAMKILGMPYGANLNGTDGIPFLLNEISGKNIVLYGTAQPWLGRAAEHFGKNHNIVAVMDGFQPDESYVAAAQKDKPEIILLGMGMPKQERVADMMSRELDYPCLIINGGAVMDFVADRFPRAPLWVRKIGMEWLYRLVKEPVRLFNRYVIGNGVFLIRLGLSSLSTSCSAK